jgi:hypothetical protein
MQGHVDKHTTGPSCVFNEEPRRIILVAHLTSENGRPPDLALARNIVCVMVRFIETA